MKLLGIINAEFDITDQILIIFLCICQALEKKMGVQEDSTSAIHRLQESLLFREEGSIVQYSHRVWCPHEISQAD
jgi:hypothetical protein